MDSAKVDITKEEYSQMIAEIGKTRLSSQKAAAMIDHKQQEHDKLFSCRTCQHYVHYQATKMQARIPKLDLCTQDLKQLKPLPPGGHGCELHTMATQECYMGEPGEESKGGIEVNIKPGDVLLPVPKENMTLIRVDKDIVILATQQGKEYELNIADWNFDVADQAKLPNQKPDSWINGDNCKTGDLVQIVSTHSFNYRTKTGEWLILKDGNGKEVTIPRKDYVVHFVSDPRNVFNQNKKVEVVKC